MSIKQFVNNQVINNPFQRKEKELPFPTYKKAYKKNEVITRFGQIEKKAYFLIEGIIESIIEKDGDIKIIDFVFPNNFICSYTSFLLQTPSEIQTQTVIDCEVEFFLKEDLEEAYKNSILANQFGRFVTEKFFLSKLNRENSFLTKSTKENYIDLINNNPQIIKYIPINKIAKYLGIHPESLSRIRSELKF